MILIGIALLVIIIGSIIWRGSPLHSVVWPAHPSEMHRVVWLILAAVALAISAYHLYRRR
jgi:hypothetical protein